MDLNRTLSLIFLCLSLLLSLSVNELLYGDYYKILRFAVRPEIVKVSAVLLIGLATIVYGMVFDKLTETRVHAGILIFLPAVMLSVLPIVLERDAVHFRLELSGMLLLTASILRLILTACILVAAVSLIVEFAKINKIPVAASYVAMCMIGYYAAEPYVLAVARLFDPVDVLYLTGAMISVSSLVFFLATRKSVADRQTIYKWNLLRGRHDPGKFYPLLLAGPAAGIGYILVAYLMPFMYEFHNQTLFGFAINKPAVLLFTLVALSAPVFGQYIQVMGTIRTVLFGLGCMMLGGLLLIPGQSGGWLVSASFFTAIGASAQFTAALPLVFYFAGSNKNVTWIGLYLSLALIPPTVYDYIAGIYF